MSEDGASCEITEYGDDQGTELTLQGGSVWNVTGESSLTALTVEPGSLVNGVVTVDGEAVDTAQGGMWTGRIVITPANSSGEPSGPSSEGAPSQG